MLEALLVAQMLVEAEMVLVGRMTLPESSCWDRRREAGMELEAEMAALC